MSARGVRAWLEAVDAEARGPARGAYLLVTPIGMTGLAAIERAVAAASVEVRARLEIDDWPCVSTAVQVKRRDAEHLSIASRYEALWRERYPPRAQAWLLDAGDVERLAQTKQALRAPLPRVEVAFGALHAFHLPEPRDAAGEAERFEAACRLIARDR